MDQHLVRAGFVERLPDGRYRAAEEGADGPGLNAETLTERLLAGTLQILGPDLNAEFHVKELRRACGVSPAIWKASFGPTFQGMKEKTTLGAPLVRAAHRDVYRRVSRGVYRLTEHGRSVVHAMIPTKPPSQEVPQTLPAAADIGAGFGNPQDNKEVELAAVEFVTKEYRSKGWEVEDVSKQNRGYDLLCTSDREEHVEVKGVRGRREEFIITAGEVKAAENDGKFVLCVVTAALAENKVMTRYTGPELLDKFVLKPVQYRATKRK